MYSNKIQLKRGKALDLRLSVDGGDFLPGSTLPELEIRVGEADGSSLVAKFDTAGTDGYASLTRSRQLRLTATVEKMNSLAVGSYFYDIYVTPPEGSRTKKGSGVATITGGSATSNPVLASAAALTVPDIGTDFFDVSGTTGITSIAASRQGRVVTLRFTDASPGTVADGNNLKLASTFSPTTDDVLTLRCDGTNWYEVARSAN